MSLISKQDLRGSGGGGRRGGGGGTTVVQATRTPDNLRSIDTLETLIAVSEGPIEGLANGPQSFFIAETPLVGPSGDNNFVYDHFQVYSGADNQNPVNLFLGGQASSNTVNVQVRAGTPVVRTGDLRNIDYLEVRILVSRLLRSTNDGTFNFTGQLQIEYRATNAAPGVPWTSFFPDIIGISGKTTSQYAKEYRKAVPRIDDTYDIRVTKITPEDTSGSNIFDFSWESFQEILAEAPQHNNLAMVHLVAQASDQFSSIPDMSGIWRGMIVRVPTNYDPVARSYTGFWDGNWKLAYTNNPAFIFYDFVTDDRYGVNSYYTVPVDKYDVYEAAQWCDESVPDGKGGLQPRYTFNQLITEPRSGIEQAQYIAGVFNAVTYGEADGTVRIKVDKPDQATQLFTKENVIEGRFEYSFTDLNQRFNDITVTFTNPALDWQEDRRRVFDQDSIDSFGRVPYDFIAVGCTNPHEALRRAQYKLITSLTETETVTFSTNRLGLTVEPFEIVLVCDPDMGYGISGRVQSLSVDRKTVTLRDPVFIEVGFTYEVTAVLGDRLFETTLANNPVGSVTQLLLTDAVPSDFPDRMTFSLAAGGITGNPKPYRVMKIEENEGNPDAISIVAVEINRDKYALADNLAGVEDTDYVALPAFNIVPGPVSVSFTEQFIRGSKQFHLTVSPVFDRSQYRYYAQEFRVFSRPQGEVGAFVERTIHNGDTLINHPPGAYEFRILGKSIIGQYWSNLSSVSSFYYNVTDPLSPPANVEQAYVNRSQVYWNYPQPPLDFAGFRIRWAAQTATNWAESVDLFSGLSTATSFYTTAIPQNARKLMIKAVDAFDVESEQAATILLPDQSVVQSNVVFRRDFHLEGYPGYIDQLTLTGSDLINQGVGSSVYTGTSGANIYDGGAFYTPTYTAGVYETDVIDLDTTGELIIQSSVSGASHQFWFRQVGLNSFYGDGVIYDGGRFYSQPVWQTPIHGQIINPGLFQVKYQLPATSTPTTLDSLSFIVDAEDVEEILDDVVIAPGGTRLALQRSYTKIKHVLITLQEDGNGGARYTVVDKEPTLGPLIRVYNDSGTMVQGLIDVTVKGY